jgi:hypothetical protein
MREKGAERDHTGCSPEQGASLAVQVRAVREAARLWIARAGSEDFSLKERHGLSLPPPPSKRVRDLFVELSGWFLAGVSAKRTFRFA